MKNSKDDRERIKNFCNNQNISRLCHFTPIGNLNNIVGCSEGIFSTRFLKKNNVDFCPTDKQRFDRLKNYICCNIEYPNVHYLETVQTSKSLNCIVLLLNMSHIWKKKTLFYHTNSANNYGLDKESGYDNFVSLYDEFAKVGNYYRGKNFLESVPTNLQSEILVQKRIPRKDIIGIIVETEKQAEYVKSILIKYKFGIDIKISPKLFWKEDYKDCVYRGEMPEEKKF